MKETGGGCCGVHGRYERYIVTERRAWKGLKSTVCTVLVVHWKRYGIFLHTFLVGRAKKKKWLLTSVTRN